MRNLYFEERIPSSETTMFGLCNCGSKLKELLTHAKYLYHKDVQVKIAICFSYFSLKQYGLNFIEFQRSRVFSTIVYNGFNT